MTSMNSVAKLLRRSFLLAIALSTSFVLVSCGGDDEEPKPDSYVVPSNLIIDHNTGTSNCPQLVGDFSVWNDGADSRLALADSVVVINNLPNIDVEFKSNKKEFTTFSSELEKLQVEFNCKPKESVDGNLTFKVYSKGQLLETIEKQVIVRVNK